MGPWISSQVQGVKQTMDLTPQQTYVQSVQSVNGTMHLTPQQTQVQGVNETMDLITSTGSTSDRGFDPTTDKSTGCKWDQWIDPKQTQVQGVNGTIDLNLKQI